MNLSETLNMQPDKRANFCFTVCTPLKSIKFLPPGLSRDLFASHFKVQVIRTYESVSPQKENLHLTVKFTIIEQINLTTSNHQKRHFHALSIPHGYLKPALVHSSYSPY